MLTLSWSDGNTLIPVNSCLLASTKNKNIIGPVKDFDSRTLAERRRKLAQTKAPEAMIALLDTALSAGLKADYSVKERENIIIQLLKQWSADQVQS